MDVIKPLLIDTGAFGSTNLAEATSAWNSGTTYGVGAYVNYGYKLYVSLIAGNLNHTPPTGATFWDDPISDAYWVCYGVDNRAAMFDNKGNTSSTSTTSFYHRWSSGQTIASIAVLNVNAVTVQLVVKDNSYAGTIVYDQTLGLSTVTIGDWYDYFFLPVTTDISQLIFNAIPPPVYGHSNYYEITVTGVTGSTVSVGSIFCGPKYFIGLTQYDTKAGISDYSQKTTDVYGNVSITKRAFSKKLTANIEVANADLNRVQALMYTLRATPCVWIGSDDARLQEALILYGFYQDFSTSISYPNHSLMSLDIQGLT